MSEKKEILEESKKIIEKYKLLPHVEGGYFIELYSSASLLKSSNDRPLAGSIYFLLDKMIFLIFIELIVKKYGIIIKELE